MIDFEYKKEFQKCLELLKLANKSETNKMLIQSYICERFLVSPKKFFQFIQFYRQKVLEEQDYYFRKRFAVYYLDILSPLCLKFNFFQEKSTLDDLCFQITDPKKYYEIYSLLLKYQHQSKKVVRKIEKNLQQLLKQLEDISIKEIKGRYKNIYSIHKKIIKRRKSIFELNDIFAFRIVLNNNRIRDCFKILNFLHDRFEPVVDFFNDYITIPKINGYQSLHTGLKNIIPQLDIPVEIQIRTEMMHHFAENGLAAHWIYAQEKKSKLVTDKEQKLIKYLSREPEKSAEETTYCLSYDYDIIKIGKNNSLLDFAYLIHTDLGHRALYGLVNQEKRPLSYIVQDADCIHIIQSKNIQVKENWLSLVKSKNALKSISDYLKQHDKLKK